MNPSSLQTDYRNIYEEFFQTNELIFSIPYSFCLGNVALRYDENFLHARANIDKRLYIGITFTSTA